MRKTPHPSPDGARAIIHYCQIALWYRRSGPPRIALTPPQPTAPSAVPHSPWAPVRSSSLLSESSGERGEKYSSALSTSAGAIRISASGSKMTSLPPRRVAGGSHPPRCHRTQWSLLHWPNNNPRQPLRSALSAPISYVGFLPHAHICYTVPHTCPLCIAEVAQARDLLQARHPRRLIHGHIQYLSGRFATGYRWHHST